MADRAAQPPAATVALACSGDALLRAQRRLEALAVDYDVRLDRLVRRFEHLPVAADFDPFAVDSTAAPEAAAPAEVAATQRHAPRRPSGSAEAPSMQATLRALIEQAARATPTMASTAVQVGAQRTADAGSAGAAAAAIPAASPGHHGAAQRSEWLNALGSLAAAGGEQVAALMQRHGLPPAVGRGAAPATNNPRRHMASDDAAAGMADGLGVGLAQVLLDLSPSQRANIAGGAPSGLAPLAGATAVTARVRTGPPLETPSLAPDWPKAPALLDHLLASVAVGAAQGSADGIGPAGLAKHSVAPRAASRLVGAPAPAANPGHAGTPGLAPAGTALEPLEAGEAMAQQINRLLLDQAWMRGVDLS